MLTAMVEKCLNIQKLSVKNQARLEYDQENISSEQDENAHHLHLLNIAIFH